MTLSTFNYTDNMSSTDKPLLSEVRETLESFESHVNDEYVPAILQLAADMYPEGYPLTGESFLDNGLSLKQYATGSISDTSASIEENSVFVRAANFQFVGVDPEVTGNYKVIVGFVVKIVTTGAVNDFDAYFRISDTETTSSHVAHVKSASGISGTTMTVPILIEHVFENVDNQKTYYLEYKADSVSQVTATVVSSVEDAVYFYMEKV